MVSSKPSTNFLHVLHEVDPTQIAFEPVSIPSFIDVFWDPNRRGV